MFTKSSAAGAMSFTPLADADALERHLVDALRPQGERVGAGAGGRDADLLAVELPDALDRRVRLHAEDPSGPFVPVGGDDLREHAALARGGDERHSHGSE